MKIKYKPMIFGLSVTISSTGAWAQQAEPAAVEPALSFKASYTGDVVTNFSGGIKTGTVYLGLANIKADFNTETANWWKGGEMFINAGNTHGGEPSATMVGDFQGISNIEAGNHSFLYELWYKQTFRKVDATVGLQDLNANFATCENGALFTNSSFGIHSSIADNVSPPIFPLTALGATIRWNPSDRFMWKAAVFDGTPDDFDKNPYNINWKLSKNQGFLVITEFQTHSSLLPGEKGTYKAGVYYHHHIDTLNIESNDGGFYFVGDQQITERLSVFSQIGLSPKKMNKNNRYFSIGINCNVSEKRPDDQFGMAIAYAGIDDNFVGSETAIELTYKLQVNKNSYVRPDMQYIINPAGTETKLGNALVGFIRFGIEF
ncbi:MAG: carbohydrate porin [Bacteroidota bacterium]|nr:carbohydrate porin [Bacteroidota bacterium]